MPQDEAPIQAMENSSKAPRLLASTVDTYSCTIAESRIRERDPRDGTPELDKGPTRLDHEEDLEANYFKSAQW